MTQLTEVHARAKDLLQTLPSGQMVKEARERHMSLSALLEQEDPSQGYNDGLDAFERLLMVADVKTNSDQASGIYAHTVSRFAETPETRALFGEWCYRRWREASTGRPARMVNVFHDTLPRNAQGERAGVPMYLGTDQPVGTPQYPIDFSMVPRYQQIAPIIPLDEIIAVTTPIDGGTYEAFYLNDTAAQRRFVEIAEGAEVPTVRITGSNHIVKMHKFGRALDASYESLRRMRIDILALHIARMAVQAEMDKVAAAMSVMVNGDGNGNAATNYNLTSLDSGASAGTLTLKAWLTFKSLWLNPYGLTHILAQQPMILQTQLLNTGSNNIPLVFVQGGSNFGKFVPINRQLADDVRFGLTADAPANVIIGFDARFAMERVVENGSDIMETTRWIENQTQRLVMTTDENYVVFDSAAIKTLTVNA